MAGQLRLKSTRRAGSLTRLWLLWSGAVATCVLVLWLGLATRWLSSPEIIFSDSLFYTEADLARAKSAVSAALEKQRLWGLPRPAIILGRRSLAMELLANPEVKGVGPVSLGFGPKGVAELKISALVLRHELPYISAEDGWWEVGPSGGVQPVSAQVGTSKQLSFPATLAPYGESMVLGSKEKTNLVTWLYDTRLPWPVYGAELVPVYSVTSKEGPDGTLMTEHLLSPLVEAKVRLQNSQGEVLPVKIFVSLSDNEAAARLRSFLESGHVANIGDLAYIDLRYGERVFVCAFNQVCNPGDRLTQPAE